MNGSYLRDLEVSYTAERLEDEVGGRLILLLALVPGGLYWLGGAQGMGIKYLLYGFFWTSFACAHLPSVGWYAVCWLGGILNFWLSWSAWQKKRRAEAKEATQSGEEELTITINL